MRRPRSFLGAEQQARGERGGDGGPLPLFSQPAPKPEPTPFERGMEASRAAASKWSIEECATVDGAIRQLAASGERFTSDDVWRICPSVPFGKGLGGRLNAAARAGVIRNTGDMVISSRGGEHDHAQRLTVWVGGRA